MNSSRQHLYRPEYFSYLREGSRRSAGAIVPLVVEIMHPNSVIDFGCGTGTWLAVFQEYGVPDVLGIDGDYVERSSLEIHEERFLAWDLTSHLRLDRTFDLAISLEVGEHLPASSAEDFVASLTSAAPVVLFSAAIPFQKGQGHVNEQWPDYWADLFAMQNYVCIDLLRPILWNDEAVEWWYAQNILIYASQEILNRYPALQGEYRSHGGRHPLRLVHPRHYLEVIQWIKHHRNE